MVDIVQRLINHKVLALTGSEDIDFPTTVHIGGDLTISGTFPGGDVNLSGLVPYTGAISDLDMGTHSIVTTGSYVGSGTFGQLGVGGSMITGIGSPTNLTDAANKAYVDNNGGGGGAVESIIAGEGIDVNSPTGDVTVSAEIATSSNRGVSSFNISDFSVSSGAVSLRSKTSYWSAPGLAFLPAHEQAQFLRQFQNFTYVSQESEVNIFLPVYLPNGAVVTSVIVYGISTDEEWEFNYRTLSSSTGAFIVASSTLGSSDSANHTINNNTRGYFLRVKNIDSSDIIYGARITYTTDYA